MPNEPKSHIHPAFLLGASGAVTGLFSWLVLVYDLETTSYFLGVVFGAAVAASLWFLYRLSLGRALFMVAMFGASWQIAYRFAGNFIAAHDMAYVGGALAGALGSGILVICFALLFRGFRRLKPIVRTLVIGALAGTILGGLDNDLAMFALFIVWQTAVGTSLGLERDAFSQP